jgi:MFS family permease
VLVEHIFSHHEHFDADQLIAQLPAKGADGYVSRPTVYRTLTEFVDAGLLRKFELNGRAVYGLGIAFSIHSAPVYISEMAPADKRGLLVSLKEGFIVLGILMGFGATAIAKDVLDEATVYRAIWLPTSAIACVIFIGMSLMPESARWLLLRGDPSDVSPSQATIHTYPSPTIFGTSATGSHGLQRSTLLAEEATGRSPSGTAAAAALRRFRRGASLRSRSRPRSRPRLPRSR